jgi:signal peptidase II
MKALPRKYSLFVAVAFVALVLDQWTKLLILERFSLAESKSIIEGFFSLTYVRNTGAAFGFMANAPEAVRIPFFVILPAGALTFILWVLSRLDRDDVKIACALGLVFGGAIGNLIDRSLYGYVVDFLDFHWNYRKHFPAFNVADSAICVGVFVLMLEILFEDAPRTS